MMDKVKRGECESCKWWSRLLPQCVEDLYDLDGDEGSVGICHFLTIESCGGEGTANVGSIRTSPNFSDKDPTTFYTSFDFGCNMHEPK